MRDGLRTMLLAILLLTWIAAHAAAQCGPRWIPGHGIPGLTHQPDAAMLWDPDGAGPRPESLVVAGPFWTAGTTQALDIALWNGQRWERLGPVGATPLGSNMSVRAMATLANGDLAVGGIYTGHSQPTAHIARFDGTNWVQVLGSLACTSGAPRVDAMATLPGGDLVVGGNFETAGGVLVNNIARWDGKAWHAMGGGVTRTGGADAIVYALEVRPNGLLIAAGAFSEANGEPAANIAQWDGQSWAPLAQGTNGTVVSLAAMPGGDLVAAGGFTIAGTVGSAGVARWDGATWAPMGGGLGTQVYTLATTTTGALVAGGRFGAGGGLAVWDGANWAPFAPPLGKAQGPATNFNQVDPYADIVVPAPDGGLFVGGNFTLAGETVASFIAHWDTQAWRSLGEGTNRWITAVTTDHAGDVIAVGPFWTIGGTPCRGIARWDGVEWNPVGGGIAGDVADVAILPDGKIVAAGSFSLAGSTAVNNIAVFDGTAWSPLGSGLVGPSGPFTWIVTALAVLPDGDLVASGNFTQAGGTPAQGCARWDGTAWHAMAPPSMSVQDFLVRTDGTLLAAGMPSPLTMPPRCVARWTGSQWVTMGSNFGWSIFGWTSSADVLAETPAGELFVGGFFEYWSTVPAIGAARWNGTDWESLGLGRNSRINDIVIGPDGEPIITGNIADSSGTAAAAIQRRIGGGWESLPGYPNYGAGLLLYLEDRGEVLSTGGYIAHPDLATSYFARFSLDSTPWIARHPSP